MSNLTIAEKNGFDKLPPALRDYTIARIETPFKELNQFQQKSGALEVIAAAFIDLNTTFKNKEEESDIKTFQTNFLIKELSGQYGSLTLSEIKRAFYMGVRNEFNTEKEKWYSMCPASYHFFLKKYYNLPQRTEGMKQYLEIVKAENKVELTPEEKKQKSKDALVWYFNEYKRTKKLGSGSYAMYESLYYGFGLCRFSHLEALDLKNSVQKKWKEYEKQPKKNHYKAMFEGEILEQAPTLKGELRKEALKRYFNSLIAEKKELKDIIK